MTTFPSTAVDKEICIMVVDDDPVCENIVGRMLQHCCHYEVMKIGRINGGLNIIRERKDRLQLVLTNIQKTTQNGSKILMQIEREFKLPLLPITPYEKGPLSPSSSSSSSLSSNQEDLNCVAKLCFLKSVSMEEFKRVWQHAYTKEKEKMGTNNNINNNGNHSNAVEDNGSLSSNQKKRGLEENINNGSSCSSQKKRVAVTAANAVDETDQESTKEESKQRIVWNQWMHLKFVDAIRQLGPDRAIPKKIVEVMNIPGLTRENVASHLQKHRMNIKRAEERSRQMDQISGFHQPNQFTEPSSIFQSSLCPVPSFNYTHQPLFGLTNQYQNTNTNPHAAASSFILPADHHQIGNPTLSSGNKNVNNESGNSYIGFRLTGNGISVETGRQMINCPVTEMVNELSDEGSLFLQCSAESSSVDDHFFPNNMMMQTQQIPLLQGDNNNNNNNNLVLELDNSGIDVDLDDLLKNAEAAVERSISPNEFIFNGSIFDDILFSNVD